MVNIATFDTPEKAALAVDREIIRAFGFQTNRSALNFPQKFEAFAKEFVTIIFDDH